MTRSGDSNGDAFWAFSLRIYGAPGAGEACLALQDDAGADVNIVLFILWRADAGILLAPADVKQLDDLVTAWRAEVVQPLRTVRRKLKLSHNPVQHAAAQELRAKVKSLELEGERLQQFAMARHAVQIGGRVGAERDVAARQGLAAYGALLGAELPYLHVAALLEIFGATATGAS